jgi:hypothetical protein
VGKSPLLPGKEISHVSLCPAPPCCSGVFRFPSPWPGLLPRTQCPAKDTYAPKLSSPAQRTRPALPCCTQKRTKRGDNTGISTTHLYVCTHPIAAAHAVTPHTLLPAGTEVWTHEPTCTVSQWATALFCIHTQLWTFQPVQTLTAVNVQGWSLEIWGSRGRCGWERLTIVFAAPGLCTK